MEGNLCWNCRHIVTCESSARPCCKNDCDRFSPFEKTLTYAKLGEYLGIAEQSVKTIIQRKGPDGIVERMKKKGIVVRFTYTNQYLKFYKVATNA